MMMKLMLLAQLVTVAASYTSGPLFGGIPTVTIAKGVHMPLQGLGTWEYNETHTEQAVLTALTLKPTPYVHIDTALVYGNQKGVARGIKAAGRDRKSLFITTKIPGGLNASATQAALEQDLEELQMEYVDLMLIHFPCTMDAAAAGGKQSRQTMWKVLEKFVAAGKARAIGVSHYCQRQLEDILEIATIPIAVNQVQYHVGMGTAGPNATDSKAFCDKHGITYQSFSPLCGPCGTSELLNGPLVTAIGAKHGKSGAQVSLKWQVQQGIPVIPKSANAAHQQENIDLFSWSLTAEEMATLTAATSPAVAGGTGSGANATSGDCSIA